MSAYSTGHSAEATANSVPAATIAATTTRHRGDGSRPSGKHINVTPVSTNTNGRGHTPSHVIHSAPGRAPASSAAADKPYWRPKNITAWASPVAMNSQPSRWPGRFVSTNTPTAVNDTAMSPLCRFAR